MKAKFFLPAIIFFLIVTGCHQTDQTNSNYNLMKDQAFDQGSNIVFPELNEQKIEDLELLGRIWGFLKYHHPAVATGNYNWDYELFRMLPAYLEADNHKQRDRILFKWIKQYGKIPACTSCRATPDSAFIKPDLSWMEKNNINRKLKDVLWNIYVNRYQGRHYYIQMKPYDIFSNEKTYEGMACPDAGFRLLALYRYWNMIYYFFPYKYLTDQDWNTVLKEYIPCFIEASDRLAYELTAARLLGEICDSHAFLWKGWGKIDSLRGNKWVPVRVRFVENRLVVTNTYEKTGLKTGDIITHIDGKPVASIVDSVKQYYPASNETVRLRDIARDFLRSPNSHTIHVNYISSDTIKQKTLPLVERDRWIYYQKRKDTTRCYKLISKDIGYVTLKTITKEDIPVIKKKLMNTKGIIMDMRNYPSYFVPYLLGAYFVSEDTPFVKLTQGNPDNPGEFTFIPTGLKIPKSEEHYQGKLVVMVNEDTQSQAEWTVMAFQAGTNTTIIGSQTAGADGNVSRIVLPGGLNTMISGFGVYYPDGRETQRIGIVPDIEVKPTIQGIREGRDELLEKAMEIIRRE